MGCVGGWEGTPSSGKGYPIYMGIGGPVGAKAVGWGEEVRANLKGKLEESLSLRHPRFPRSLGGSFWPITQGHKHREAMLHVLSRESPWHTMVSVPFARGGPSYTSLTHQGQEPI